MSSFFTLPASQKKRKRTEGDASSRGQDKKASKSRATRDESISGSDDSDDEGHTIARGQEDGTESGDEDLEDEDPAAKRIRLAEQYLANTQREVLDEAGFDAKDVDEENLRQRMGERLKEDTAEAKGRLYRWIAQDFDWSKGKRIQFRHHQKAVTGVAVSGEHAYTVGNDSILVKWKLPGPPSATDSVGPPRSRKPQRILTSRPLGKNTNTQHKDHHTNQILCVAASQDGKFVATGGKDKRLIVWDAATLKPLRVFPQHRDSIISLAFRRGTNQLFSASKDRTVKIWSLDELTYVETLFGHQDEVVDVSALAQEQCVTVGARDRTARLWKVVEESQLVFRGGGAPSKSKLLKAHGNDSGIELAEDDPPNEGSTDRVACIDDETFVTGSDNGSLSLWNVHKKKAVDTWPLAHGMDPPLPLEEVSAEEVPPEAARTKPLARWITALKAIPFSDVFVTGSWDGYIRVWKISSDKRRIEPLGRIGVPEGLQDASQQSDGKEVEDHRVEGIINDLVIEDRGERAKDGIIILAAIGKEHRLGRWKEMKDAKNIAVLFELPRKVPAVEEDESSDRTLNGEKEGDEEFAGFD